MNLIKSLTGLRGYAALLVFVAHMYHLDYLGAQEWLKEGMAKLGPGGVSLFFVLSGFVLFINYDWKSISFSRFYIARFARIYPAYFLGLLLAAPLELFSPDKNGLFLSFLANVFLIQQFFPATAGTWNDVGWTLSVEAFFYLSFPFVLIFIKDSFRRATALTAISLIFILCINLYFKPHYYSTYHFPPNRTFEFLVGVMGATAYSHHKLANVRRGYLYTLLVFGGISFLATAALVGRLSFSSSIPQVFFGISSAFIVFALAWLERQGFSHSLLTSHWALFCGEISYSFYLFHNLVLRYFTHGMKIVIGQDPAEWPFYLQVGSAILLFVATFFSSALIFRFLEVPARKVIRNSFRSREPAVV